MDSKADLPIFKSQLPYLQTKIEQNSNTLWIRCSTWQMGWLDHWCYRVIVGNKYLSAWKVLGTLKCTSIISFYIILLFIGSICYILHFLYPNARAKVIRFYIRQNCTQVSTKTPNHEITTTCGDRGTYACLRSCSVFAFMWRSIRVEKQGKMTGGQI
jgi:hypothetical protein